jgi:putative chitinase
MPISKRELENCLPDARLSDIDRYYTHLVNGMEDFKINTSRRIASFIAQIAVESGSLRFVEENLNYSSERLMQIFPRHFRTVNPTNFHRQPQKIANLVYANRMGNGDMNSGDGWRFRGRGLKQLTGRFNYIECGNALGVDLLRNPDWLLTPEGASTSACWYWDWKNINPVADREDFRRVTILINGGLNGFDQRLRYYNIARKVLNF